MASDTGPSDESRIPVEPRDAASLVLIREGARGPEVLMGRRPTTARFMPGVYVFPGGAVDESDFTMQSDHGLAEDVLARLRRQARQPLAHALAWAAIRETWEETGLLLGRAGSVSGQADSPAVRAFAAAGLAPDLAALDYLMRAVTPPYIRIRFNTRFFIADATAVQGTLKPSPELEDDHQRHRGRPRRGQALLGGKARAGPAPPHPDVHAIFPRAGRAAGGIALTSGAARSFIRP